MPGPRLPGDGPVADHLAAEGPDLRLMGLVAGAWMGVLSAFRAGFGGALVTAILAGLGGLALVLVGRRVVGRRSVAVPGALLVAGVVLLGVCCGGVAALRVVGRSDGGGLVGRLVAERAVVRMGLTLQDDPRRPPWSTASGATGSTGATGAAGVAGADNGGAGEEGGGRGLAGGTWVVGARWEWVVVGDGLGRVVGVGVTVVGVGDGWRGLLPGQRVEVRGRVGAPWGRGAGVAEVTAVAGVVVRGRAPWYQRWAGRLRGGLRRACAGLPGGADGLLPGLVDGDTSGLDPEVRRRFLVAGMSHLTAVSGSNLAIVLGFVLVVGRWARLGSRVGAVVGMVATAGFVVLVRPDPSVLRAAVMGGLGLVGVVLRRPGAAVPLLAAGVFGLLVVDPELAVSAGFALSALATVGLLLFGVAWRDGLRRRGVPAGLAEAVAVPVAAQVACAPVIAGISGAVGVGAVPANLLAEPAVAPATVLGVGAAAVSPVSPAVAHLLAWLAAWPCRWLILVAGWADRPASLVPWPAGVGGALLLAVVLVAGLLIGSAHRLAGWTLAALTAGALAAWLLTAGWPRPG